MKYVLIATLCLLLPLGCTKTEVRETKKDTVAVYRIRGNFSGQPMDLHISHKEHEVGHETAEYENRFPPVIGQGLVAMAEVALPAGGNMLLPGLGGALGTAAASAIGAYVLGKHNEKKKHHDA